MTRDEAYAELVARLNHDIVTSGRDYCEGEDRQVRRLLERFKRNDPVTVNLTAVAAQAVDDALSVRCVDTVDCLCSACDIPPVVTRTRRVELRHRILLEAAEICEAVAAEYGSLSAQSALAAARRVRALAGVYE